MHKRVELIRALGVDAIAIAKVKYVVGSKGGVSIGGIGKITKYPKAIVELSVYDAKSEAPIWREPWAEGKTMVEGFSNTLGVKSKENEAEILTSAADSALDTLVTRYQDAR
jgi:hypothetical protein